MMTMTRITPSFLIGGKSWAHVNWTTMPSRNKKGTLPVPTKTRYQSIGRLHRRLLLLINIDPVIQWLYLIGHANASKLPSSKGFTHQGKGEKLWHTLIHIFSPCAFSSNGFSRIDFLHYPVFTWSLFPLARNAYLMGKISTALDRISPFTVHGLDSTVNALV